MRRPPLCPVHVHPSVDLSIDFRPDRDGTERRKRKRGSSEYGATRTRYPKTADQRDTLGTEDSHLERERESRRDTHRMCCAS